MSSAKESKDTKGDKQHGEGLGDTISLEILQVIKDAQGQHGLKHGDYQRYRAYCSRRVRRLRKSLNFVQSTGSKARSTFQLKKITNQLIYDAVKAKKEAVRFLYIPLILSERAWAYAMQLKQEANTEPRKRFHLIGKLRKAVKYSQDLEALCNDEPTKCDARTKLESKAYSSYLNGIYYFEIENWIKSSEYLKKAQSIYMKLCEAIGDDAIYYHQRVDELKPTLRYCDFNIGGEKDIKATDLIDKLQNDATRVEDEVLSAKIDQLILQAREKQAVTLSEVQWLGKSIAVKHEKIRAFLMSVRDIESVNSPKINQLEKLLFECRDCIQYLRDNSQEKSSLYYYLTYIRLHLSCMRNLQLIKTLNNPSELMRPYEIIIGSLNEMRSLPLEQYFSTDSDVATFREEIDAQITAYKAFRCYYIGNVSRANWREAVALLHRSSVYANTALKNELVKKDMKQKLEKLVAKIEGEKFTIYANSLMKETDETQKTDSRNKIPLIQRLDSYIEDAEVASGSTPLADFPPQFKPIPCKPLFFDLALSHIEFPSLDAEMTDPKVGGITGFVKGWFSAGWKK